MDTRLRKLLGANKLQRLVICTEITEVQVGYEKNQHPGSRDSEVCRQQGADLQSND